MKKFLKKIKLKIINFLINTWVYNFSLKHIIPWVRFSTYYAQPSNPNFTDWGPLRKRGQKILKPGHIILAIDEKNFAGLVIGKITANEVGIDNDKDGKDDIFTHAAFCVSNNSKDEFEIAEMTHTNFTKSCFSDVCYKSTRVLILECDDFDNKYIKKMIGLSKYFENVKYDNQFEMGDQRKHDATKAEEFLKDKFVFGNEHLACSELIYEYDFERRLVVTLDPLLGVKEYISPMGLMKAANIRIIWDSNNES